MIPATGREKCACPSEKSNVILRTRPESFVGLFLTALHLFGTEHSGVER